MKGLDYTALTVAIIGAVNWGLIGFFRLDLVALVFRFLYKSFPKGRQLMHFL